MTEQGTQQALMVAQPQPVAPTFFPLDQRVIQLWRLSVGLLFAVLWLVALVSLLIQGWFQPDWLWPLLFGWCALVLASAALVMWYPARAYQAWSWRIDNKVLETRSGIWFRHTRLLPLSRLQHIDLESGPLARRFGLASLVLHTAGTQNASLTIPGLEAAYTARLRDWLVELGGNDVD
jgi:membrane protein YdbS with pleckstrin-like domain